MSFFDNLGKTISSASQGALQKGKELADVAKYNSMISDEERNIKEAYEQIGKLYVEKFSESPAEFFTEYLDAINISNGKIAEYQEKIKEIKGVSKCASCGAEIPNGSAFCPSCGAKTVTASTETVSEETCVDADAVEVKTENKENGNEN